MRAFSPSPSSTPAPSAAPLAGGTAFPAAQQDPRAALFAPFSPDVFALAQRRRVPVFLVIGEIDGAFLDPSLTAQLIERTVPARLLPGERPDVELLCQRAAALFSGEGALPLCALLLENGLPFLAAPLPPAGFALDPSRLFIWLTHTDRRLTQNRAAFLRQAADVLRSFEAPALLKPYAPKDAAHDLLRAILAAQDGVNGGFGQVKAPHAPLLRFLMREGARGSRPAHAALSKALAAMREGALYDPVDGLFFRSTLTADWRVFVPEKPLGVNALLAKTLLESGQRNEAIRALDAILDRFALPGGGFAPALRAPRSRYALSPEQVCALLGGEDGLRACRLLNLLRQQRKSDPAVSPSRFSPPPPQGAPRPSLDAPGEPLCPQLSGGLVPEDEAFLRRALPVLSRARAAREPERPTGPMLTMDCALAAAIFASCGRRLGEARYTQAAQRAVLALLERMPGAGSPGALAPSSTAPGSQPTLGASAALALALLTLAEDEPAGPYAVSGLRLLGGALHAFTRENGMPMHTPPAPGTVFPRVPALFDGELPSPAALLVLALQKAQALRPDVPYRDAIDAIFIAAAPSMKHEPLACASLIDAIAET